MRFVLDNSVAMRWLFSDGTTSDLSYAGHVLDVLEGANAGAVVPAIWGLGITGSDTVKYCTAGIAAKTM